MKQITYLLAVMLISTLLTAQSIPNGDFEHWSTFNFYEPSGWISSNTETIHNNNWITVIPVDGHDGVGHGIRLRTDGQNGRVMPGYFSNTTGDPLLGQGGTGYHELPHSIKGYARYHTFGADTALLVIAFKKLGEVIGVKVIPFSGFQEDYVQFDELLDISIVPDTVVMAAVSSDVRNPELMETNSFLELDDLSFEGRWVLPQLPNSDFEEWEHTFIHHAQEWKVDGRLVERTEDTPFGDYAITMSSYTDWDGHVHSSGIQTGYMASNGEWFGGLPYGELSDTLRGWYKYLSDGADAGCLALEMLHGDVSLGGAFYQFYPTEDWTYFEIPMQLLQEPDTLRLQIMSTAYPFDEATAGSTLFIDNLQLSSQPLLFTEQFAIASPGNAYPNPAVALLHIPLPSNYKGDIQVLVYNEQGALAKTLNEHQPESIVRLPLEDLAPGAYTYEVRSGDWLYGGRFVKNR
jgi:hypothetical protein